jgi:LacI family transcriptional regulator
MVSSPSPSIAAGFVPTIKDVARAAGVHFTTVSMALRGDPRLRAETRDRVFAAVARVGYRRTDVSTALSRRRSGSRLAPVSARVAYLANRAPEHGLERLDYFRRVVQGAREQAEALGYEFELLFLDRGHHDSASLHRHLRHRGVRGIILGAFEPNRQTLELPWEEFCIVKFDSRHMAPAATFVSNDQMQATRLAFQRLRALGYRRIGLAIGVTDEVGTGELPLAGYLLEQRTIRAGQRVRPLHFPPGATDAEVCAVIGPWLRDERVDAVISTWTSIRRLLRTIGVRGPEDVACACACLSQRTPGQAGVIANLELVGREAVTRLAGLLRAEQYGVPAFPTSTYVEGIWSDGASAPPRR